jgi:hypothetical protein
LTSALSSSHGQASALLAHLLKPVVTDHKANRSPQTGRVHFLCRIEQDHES